MGAEDVEVVSHGEPSDAAWKRFGRIGADILRRLAIRDAERAALAVEDSGCAA